MKLFILLVSNVLGDWKPINSWHSFTICILPVLNIFMCTRLTVKSSDRKSVLVKEQASNYLRIRWPDFCNLFTEWKRFGCRWSSWTSFSISQGTWPWQSILWKMANSPLSTLWHSETEWDIATLTCALTAKWCLYIVLKFREIRSSNSRVDRAHCERVVRHGQKLVYLVEYLRIYWTDLCNLCTIMRALWMQMINLDFIFRSGKGRWHGNKIILP